MADTKPITISVHERLLELSGLGLSSDVLQTIKAITDYRPVKVDVEVLLPAAPEADAKQKTKLFDADELQQKKFLIQGKAAVREVVARYESALGKQLADALRAVNEKYTQDQAGQSGCFSAAESILSKISKLIETRFEDFRVDLREAIAKRLELSAKSLMTVGRVSTKEISIVLGSFKSEIDVSDDRVRGNDLAGCFKKKKWQHVGAAFGSSEGKVFVDPKKKFKKADLKKLEELFDDDDRNGLKFAKGQVQAESETNLHFEFIKKEGKLPGNDGVIRKLLMKGLKSQTGKNYSSIDVKIVEKYSAEVGESSKPSDEDGKPKSTPSPTPTKKKGTK